MRPVRPKQEHAKHGTRSRYTNQECRCAKCKKANRLYSQELRARNGRVKRGR